MTSFELIYLLLWSSNKFRGVNINFKNFCFPSLKSKISICVSVDKMLSSFKNDKQSIHNNHEMVTISNVSNIPLNKFGSGFSVINPSILSTDILNQLKIL